MCRLEKKGGWCVWVPVVVVVEELWDVTLVVWKVGLLVAEVEGDLVLWRRRGRRLQEELLYTNKNDEEKDTKRKEKR